MGNNQLAIFTPEALGKLPVTTRWAAKYESGEIIKDTFLATLHEQGRAVLTNNALQNLGALTALEDTLTQMHPNNAHRYKALVDSYTVGAIQTITKW